MIRMQYGIYSVEDMMSILFSMFGHLDELLLNEIAIQHLFLQLVISFKL